MFPKAASCHAVKVHKTVAHWSQRLENCGSFGLKNVTAVGKNKIYVQKIAELCHKTIKKRHSSYKRPFACDEDDRVTRAFI